MHAHSQKVTACFQKQYNKPSLFRRSWWASAHVYIAIQLAVIAMHDAVYMQQYILSYSSQLYSYARTIAGQLYSRNQSQHLLQLSNNIQLELAIQLHNFVGKLYIAIAKATDYLDQLIMKYAQINTSSQLDIYVYIYSYSLTFLPVSFMINKVLPMYQLNGQCFQYAVNKYIQL